jgi:transposase-like protein
MSTTRHTDPIEVLVRDQRCRRWSLTEKQALVRRTYEPGMSVSLVARQEGVAATLLPPFVWPKPYLYSELKGDFPC